MSRTLLLSALASSLGSFLFGWPSIIAEGLVLPEEWTESLRRGDCAVKVPLVIGSNKEETKLFLFFDRSLDWRSDYYAALAKYGSERWRAEGVDEIAWAVASSISRLQPTMPPNAESGSASRART